MSSLFERVREACSREAWSRGVERARAGAVTAERRGDAELVLRVAQPGSPVARTVVLAPAAETWECDCAGADDPCEHVAAAVIALRRAADAGGALPSAAERGAGRLRYALARSPQGIALERQVVVGERVEPLRVSLRALAAGGVRGPRVVAGEADLAVDDALFSPLPGPLSAASAQRVLPLLAACEDVRLDGVPVRTSREPLMPVVWVEDHPSGFLLRLELAPGASEHLGGGLVRCGDVLRPLGGVRLTGRELEELPGGRVYPFERAAELAAEVLPGLRGRVEVEVRTTRLPRTARREPPRLRIATRRADGGLAARAELVYGEPPRARVEAGRLVALGGEVPPRDEAAERALARRAQHQLGLPIGTEVVVHGGEALELAERLRAFEGLVHGDAHRAFVRAAPLLARVAVEGDGFELWFEPDTSAGDADGVGGTRGRRVGAGAVLRAWEQGHDWVSVEGAGLAPLPSDWLARFGREAAALLEQRRADGTLPRCALPAAGALCEALGAPAPAALAPLRALVRGFEAIPRAALPADLRAELRGYQRAGVDWLCFLRDAGLGALLADDMGLGKTLQVLCALRGRALVVAPTSVLVAWSEEIRRFRPGLSLALFHGAARRLDPRADVTLTSYAILRLDAEALAEVAWDAVVLDEAQAVKNPESQVARAAHALRAGWRVAVTGTPVENRLEELWSLSEFANPGLLGTRASFARRWAQSIADGEPGVAEALRRRLRPFLLRRIKREVAPELPPRTEVVLRCELDAAERAVYEAVRAATRRDVVERLARGASPLAALEALLRLRQAACHRGLVPGQQAATSSKLALLLEELETAVADGHKALVFSQWTSLLDRVEPLLRGAGIAWERLDGSTRDRGGVVARFQDDAGPPVLLVSLRAGGAGLTLTAADHVFLLDPWWNPAVEEQAGDRAHRIGQTRPVEIHRLVSADTVEERVLDLQSRKRALADAALGDAAQAAALTRDDLLALLD